MENKVYFNGSAQDGKQVALTFDDGPDAIVTPKILDILKENDIKATFLFWETGLRLILRSLGGLLRKAML